ncbi:c-type cytochrome [Mesobacillus sp.]|uniref:c-type cytochrome n=1 Tax=Mesobacillus sp. TaxID=2675271 RepID=UPI0039F0F7DE
MRNVRWLSFLIIALVFVFAACNNDSANKDPEETQSKNTDGNTNQQASDSKKNEGNDTGDELAYDPPSMEELDPKNPMTEYIEYGQKVFHETDTVLDEYVGNQLSCSSCHADAGLARSSSMVGVTTQFPQYRPREGVVFTLEDRINGCMVRSMNGKMIPEDSKEMRAMMSYLTYISNGIEVGTEIPWRMLNTMKEIPLPSVENGEKLYTEKTCIACHGQNGEGKGATVGPALWGENSFNDGAGMNRMSKIAGYIQNNMPPNGGTLTDQEAADLAAYILSHERPVWGGHETDWPKGGRPTDIITKDRREKIREGTFDWSEIDNVVQPD